MRLADVRSFHMTALVDEIDVRQVQVGQSVRISVDALPDTEITGQVTEVAPTASDVNGVRCQKIGFVFQRFNLLPRTTALDNVELPLIYAGVGARAAQAGRRSTPPGRPGGIGWIIGPMSFQVAIARALSNRRAMILANKPTGNLDTKTGIEIMHLFQRLSREQGLTLIFVTHDPETADYCQRIIHIRDGVVARDAQRSPVLEPA